MSKHSDAFNAMPYEFRHIAAMSGSEAHIRQLEAEKKRLARRYRESVAEINAHIKNLQQWIDREDRAAIDAAIASQQAGGKA